jgi:uncharacterized membrane protein YjgN (DUF898 family)
MEDLVNQEHRSAEFERMRYVGSGGEFFKIWIVNIFLTILTLGFYSPWAKVRSRKYLYNSTTFRDTRFDYHADPKSILIGRIIALCIFGVYAIASAISPIGGLLGMLFVFFLIPFLMVKSLKFNIKNTSYNNIRFNFFGKVLDGYKLYFKYFSFPVLLITGALLFLYLTGMFTEEQLKDPQKSMTFLKIIGGVQIINVLYLFFISSRSLNDIFSFIYNNIYYGGSRVNIMTSKKEVFQNIFKPLFLWILGLCLVPLLIAVLAIVAKDLVPILSIVLVPLIYIGIIFISFRFPYSIIIFVWDRLHIEGGNTKTDLKLSSFIWVAFSNAILTAITFGFYFPWAIIKMQRLKVESRLVKIDSLDSISAIAQEKESALGEELVDVFDFDFEIGF